jgi:hypothetical protein
MAMEISSKKAGSALVDFGVIFAILLFHTESNPKNDWAYSLMIFLYSHRVYRSSSLD